MKAGAAVTLSEYSNPWLDELVLLWRASFEAGVGITDPHPFAEQRRYFLERVLPENTVLIAIADRQLVGFVAASRESISQLYIRVGLQRRGIGSQLLGWAKVHSSGSLWLYTFARNLGASAFYEKNGVVEVARGFEPTWQLEDIKYQWSARGLQAS